MGKNKSVHGRKNVSLIYQNASIIVTRDEYLDKTSYFSPGHSNPKDFYRLTLIVDSNRNDELVLVPLTTHKGNSPKGSVSDFVYVKDSYGNKIKLPSNYFKFRKGKKFSSYEVNAIKRKLFKTGSNVSLNKHLVHKHIKCRE